MQGSVLPHRIPRAEPWRATAGCALAIGIFLTLFGGGIAWVSLAHDDHGVPLIVGSGFGLVGLLVLYSGVHQLIASRMPETIFELEDLQVFRGKPRNGVVIQDGPVHLESLRANVVCLEHKIQRVRRNGRTETNTFTKQIRDTNVLDACTIDMREGERLQWDVVLDVPSDAEPTKPEGDRRIEWRVEIWGKVKGRPDFMHPFTIEVG